MILRIVCCYDLTQIKLTEAKQKLWHEKMEKKIENNFVGMHDCSFFIPKLISFMICKSVLIQFFAVPYKIAYVTVLFVAM